MFKKYILRLNQLCGQHCNTGMIVAGNARTSNSAAKSGKLLLLVRRDRRGNNYSDPWVRCNDARSAEAGEKKRLPFPSIRHSLRADGLPPVENSAGGWCIVKGKKKKKKSPGASIFYCLHWVPVINRAKSCAQKTAFDARLLTWHGKRAKMYVDKTSKSTTCGRKGDFVKMWECIRMQEMVWWRGGLLGETNLHMEIRVSVDKILHKVHCSLLIGNWFQHRYGVGERQESEHETGYMGQCFSVPW